MKLLRSINFFVEPIELNFYKNLYERTALGNFLTLLTVILGIIFTWQIGQDIYYKQNPYSYQQTKIEDKAHTININKTSFPIFFSIQFNLFE